ncbi:MAG TPA: FCD domain-containing protein [Pseudonocardia sp.]|nr:FCD domain-containing protein [Pseudonocardia sp.]
MPLASVPPMPRRARSISIELAAHVERLIATGVLRPGERLPPERELAASLSVSRSTLREAMHELEGKHLVERRTGRGTIVAEQAESVTELYAGLAGVRLDADVTLDDATELRLIVEPRIAAAAAVRASPSNFVQLEDVLARSALDPAAERSLELDVEFHLMLAHAARNPLLVALYTMTSRWTESVRRHSHATPEGRLRSLEGHRAIYRAVAARDAEAAATAMDEHLSTIRDVIARRTS